ncbi:GCN5 family acetyltransferase [Desulfocarbo indianensis]|nr:GCN5 family acetyltransferase [Desulfocarbo indianensis]
MHDTQVTVRDAGPGDVPALATLLQDLFSLEKDFAGDDARQIRGLETLLGRGQARLLAAEAQGRVIGMCSGQLVVSTAEGGPSAWVEDVVVESSWRGKGVGRMLLEALAAWAREQGATRLQLLADRDNQPAFRFYARLGWEKTQLICLRMRGI